MISRIVFACIGCCVATGYLALVKSARASELWFGQTQTSRAVEPCDPDFDALAGPESCMRFGGRVRVDLGGRAPAPSDRTYGAAPAAMRVEGGLDQPRRVESGVSRSHLRLPNGDPTGTIDPYGRR